MQDDGTWSATDSEGDSYAGTYVLAGGKAKRKYDFSFNASTQASLIDELEADASQLCGTPLEASLAVQISSV